VLTGALRYLLWDSGWPTDVARLELPDFLTRGGLADQLEKELKQPFLQLVLPLQAATRFGNRPHIATPMFGQSPRLMEGSFSSLRCLPEGEGASAACKPMGVGWSWLIPMQPLRKRLKRTTNGSNFATLEINIG
jgi:hypothetical protein